MIVREGYCYARCCLPRPCLCDYIDVVKRVEAIEPEDHATKSRDYGRGFAEAIRVVREALQ